MNSRYRIAAFGICALVLAVVFAPSPGNNRWIHVLHDAAHGPIFGCVAVLSLLALRSNVRFRVLRAKLQYAVAFSIAVVLGLGTEVAQSFAGRDASWGDLGRDVAGAAAFLLLFFALDRRLAHGSTSSSPSRPMRALSAVIAVLMIGLLAAPLVNAAIQYERRSQRFPVLADFTSGVSRFFVFRVGIELTPIEVPARWRRGQGETALRVQFVSEPYPGADFAEPMPDWTAYSTFALDVTNPTDLPLDLVVRIHDVHHNYEYADRFNRAFVIAPGTRQLVRIPLAEVAAGPAARELDMQQIAGLVLFREQGSASEMYVSRMWLE